MASILLCVCMWGEGGGERDKEGKRCTMRQRRKEVYYETTKEEVYYETKKERGVL